MHLIHKLSYFFVSILILSFSIDLASAHQGNSQGKSQGNPKGGYQDKTRTKNSIRLKQSPSDKERATSCRKNQMYIKRHVRRIVQQEAKATNKTGPVRVTSSVVTCGPGEIMTLAARCSVNRVRYTLHCELRPTGKNPNSPVGWDGSNHRWEQVTTRVVKSPPSTSPTPTGGQTRPSR